MYHRRSRSRYLVSRRTLRSLSDRFETARSFRHEVTYNGGIMRHRIAPDPRSSIRRYRPSLIASFCERIEIAELSVPSFA